MSFKHEMEREMRNIKSDVAKAVERVWTVDFQGQTIEIHNGMMQEKLVVDGMVIAETNRKTMWSHFMPYSTLKGTFTGTDGKTHKAYVKLGGFIKLHVTLKVDGKKVFHDTMAFVMNPWDNKEQIVAYIEAQVAAGEVGEELPDDVLLYDENHPRQAAGEADQKDVDYVLPGYPKKLVQLFITQSENPNDKTRKATYEKVVDERVVSYFGELLEVMSQTQFDEEKVQKEALWLLEHATHREVVKFAIAILGFTKCEPFKEKLQMIGLHEEFTGVVLFALRNGASGANDYAFHLAKTLKGWGRVAAIDFMEGTTPEVKHWLLTEGYKTLVAPAHVAMLCVEKGKLDVILHETDISSELYDGADGLIRLLLMDYSYDRLDGYEYAGQVMMRFTQHAKIHAKTLEHLDTLVQINTYMNRDEDDWEQLYEQSWKPHERNAVNTALERIFADKPLREEALATLHAGAKDDEAALEIAAFYDEDVMDIVFEKLQVKPFHLHYYAVVFNTENITSIERLITFVLERIDFAALEEEQRQSIRFIASNLYSYEGVGKSLLLKCLQSDEEMQYQALMAIEEWSKESWMHSALKAEVEQVSTTSPIKEIRQYAKQILDANI